MNSPLLDSGELLDTQLRKSANVTNKRQTSDGGTSPSFSKVDNDDGSFVLKENAKAGDKGAYGIEPEDEEKGVPGFGASMRPA